MAHLSTPLWSVEHHIFILPEPPFRQTSVSTFMRYRTTISVTALTAVSSHLPMPRSLPSPSLSAADSSNILLAIRELQSLVENRFNSIESRLERQERDLEEVKTSLNSLQQR
jgi:hypothetical protein